MGKEQEKIQSLGFYGILRESLIIPLSWKKLFSQITIAAIFPLSLFSLAHAQISEFLFAGIRHIEETLHHTQEGSSTYADISETLWSEKITLWLFKIVYFVFFLVLSLLSTSTVVHTVACIYKGKDRIAFSDVMSVTPKVWKRLMVTLLWSFIIVLMYNMSSFALLDPLLGFVNDSSTIQLVIVGSLLVVYVMGFLYMSIVWHLATVISVLEEDCGVEAMKKSQALVKGNMVISVAVFFCLNSCFVFIELAFRRFVVLGESIWSRIACGILCFFLLSGFTLLGLVAQTLVYLVCKSYRLEISDESYLANTLEVYLGEYAPLTSKDVQLEEV